MRLFGCAVIYGYDGNVWKWERTGCYCWGGGGGYRTAKLVILLLSPYTFPKAAFPEVVCFHHISFHIIFLKKNPNKRILSPNKWIQICAWDICCCWKLLHISPALPRVPLLVNTPAVRTKWTRASEMSGLLKGEMSRHECDLSCFGLAPKRGGLLWPLPFD